MSNNGAKKSVREWVDLPALRQNKGISLRTIADSTKISMRFLLAIEEGDFDQLPGGIYNTSYIRQYAREIGCEETELVEQYRALTSTAT
jgi:cytoskeletal protein RodZ